MAKRKTKIQKRVTSHIFRHSFASHLLQANYDIRTIQEILGHSDVRTTMIYTHTVKSRTLKEGASPLDFPQEGQEEKKTGKKKRPHENEKERRKLGSGSGHPKRIQAAKRRSLNEKKRPSGT